MITAHTTPPTRSGTCRRVVRAAAAARGLLAAALCLTGSIGTGYAAPPVQPAAPVAAPPATDAAPARRAAAPSAADFARPPVLDDVVISPGGTHVALIVTTPQGRRVAAVRGLESDSTRVVGAFADADVFRVSWVNDRRLVFDAFQPGPVVEEHGAGTFAVDLDGENFRELIAWRQTNEIPGSRVQRRGLPYGWFFHGTLDDGSDEILIHRRTTDSAGDAMVGALARLDTRSGRLTTLTDGAPPFAVQWLLDPRRELRVVSTVRDGRHRLHWRRPGGDTWTVVRDEDHLDGRRLVPLFLEGDSTLIVEGRPDGRDHTALFVLDLASGRVDPDPLLALAGFDSEAGIEFDSRTREVVGVHTLADRPASVWFHERLAQVQAAVDAALPGRFNHVSCGRCLSSRHYIVYSRSDTHPGEFLHYDHGARRLRSLGPRRPWLAESTQGPRSFHRVAARDGLPLPVVVTHPPRTGPQTAVAQPLPTIVLVHGGPWVRGGSRNWSAHAQFLATRGWRVLEVEFRGSTGFGWKHFRAGWKTWGTAMQDDLADAVAWAVREGLTDPDRVCLAGASYGGYAALMSLVRHPGVFRCGVSYVGVTDPQLLFTARWGDISEQGKRFTLPVLVGDPRDDVELLRQASPLARVQEIRGNVLLVWSLLDRRVPPEHADRFVRAARQAGVRLQTHSYGDEGHGFFHAANEADFLRRMEAFLAAEFAGPLPAR
jgi:dipeptidyl aminopeptidase/acylaminoacyl peptidase